MRLTGIGQAVATLLTSPSCRNATVAICQTSRDVDDGNEDEEDDIDALLMMA